MDEHETSTTDDRPAPVRRKHDVKALMVMAGIALVLVLLVALNMK